MANFFQSFPALRISKITIFLGLFIIVSASFMRQVMNFAKAKIGGEGFAILMGLVLLVSGLIFLISTIKNNPSLSKKLVIIVLLAAGAIFAWHMEIPEERIHILEYGILGWFASRDLIRKNKKTVGIIVALIFAVIVGIIDEVFQLFLPYRVFDWRDIALNSIGGCLGVSLYLLS